jgi:hypothetical protein
LPLLQVFRAAWGIVVQRSSADWLMVVAAWLVILSATTLLSAGVIYGDAASVSGLQRALLDAPATEANIQVRTRREPDASAPAIERAITSDLRSALGSTGGDVLRLARSESFGLPGQRQVSRLVVFGSYEGIERHAELVAGSWPASAADGPVEAALSEPAAAQLGLALGDRLQVASRTDPTHTVDAAVVGIYRVARREDPYWWGDQLELDGAATSGSFTTLGPLVVTRDDLMGRVIAGKAELTWRVFPAFDRISLADATRLRGAVDGLDEQLAAEVGDFRYVRVATKLGAILGGLERSLLVSRTGVLVLTAQLAVLAGYALVLVAGLLIERRRIETALLRSRGAGALHVAAMGLMEASLLVIPAALLGPWLAAAVLRAFNVVGPLAAVGLTLEPRVGDLAMLAAAAAALGCLLALVVPLLVSVSPLADVRRAVGRQGRRGLAQRIGLDLALVVLAGIGIWQLRRYAAPLTRSLQGSLGLDPLLVAAPAIGLLAGALLALRIVPLLAELVESFLSRRRGLVGALGSRQLARRPLRYSRSALLLMLAASLAVFAAAYSGTWLQSQQDQADYRVGADLRVEPWSHGQLLGWGLADAYGRLPGVGKAMGVVRQSFDISGAPGSGQLLAFAPDLARQVVTFRADLADEPFGDLLAGLKGAAPAPQLAKLDGGPQRLAIDLDVALRAVGDEAYPNPIPPRWPGLGTAVLARDANGLLHRFVGTPATFDGGRQRSVVSLTARLPDGTLVRPAYPLAVVAIELAATLPVDAAAVGFFELEGVASSAAPDGDDWRPVTLATDGGAQLVRRTSEGLDPNGAVPVASGSRPRIEVSQVGGLAGPGKVMYSLQPTQLAALARAPLPAIVSDRFLERTGSHIGDTLAVGSLSRRRPIEIVGSVHAFPTVDPARPVVIIDAAALALNAYATDAETSFVGEWWLTVTEGRSAEVARALGGHPYDSEQVDARREIARASQTDPVAVGIIGALSLGAVAAIVFATIGFVVSAAAGARERLPEFALLRALGLSPRQLSAWLSLESAFLLTVGVLSGIGLGLLLAWLVLPFVTLTSDAAVVNPPLRVMVPWGVIGVLLAIAAGAVLLSVLALGGLLRRVGLGSTLRLGDE